MKKKIKRHRNFLITLVLLVIFLVVFKPHDRGEPYSEYFSQLNKELKAKGYARPVIIIDMDRLDHNIQEITHHLKDRFAYRIVTKSLPSVDIIRYVAKKAQTNKLMVFHTLNLKVLLEKLGPDLDILMGKTLPVQAVAEFYRRFKEDNHVDPSNKIMWLVDSPRRLNEFKNLAEKEQLSLKVNFEIDIGLHRGAIHNEQELDQMLSIVEANSKHLTFTGFMGYEGHVPFAPPYLFLTSKKKAVHKAFQQVLERYQTHYQQAKNAHPSLFQENLTFNSGGSRTYRLFKNHVAINDISAGSGLLMPGKFNVFTLSTHKRALHIATPVIHNYSESIYPFLDKKSKYLAWWNPNMAQIFFVYGGGWPNTDIFPKGLMSDFMAGDVPNENLVPNKALLYGSKNVHLDEGDFVFYRPNQSDALKQFETILVIRKNKIIGEWKPFSIGL